MSDEVSSKGLLALKLGNPMGSPRYETNQFPAIPKHIRIIFRESNMQGFANAQMFLQQEGVRFNLPRAENSNHLIVIEGKENTKLLYNIMNDFSIKARHVNLGGFGPTSDVIAAGLLWHLFGPWLQRALALPRARKSSVIAMRQVDSFTANVREKAREFLEGMGFEPAKVQSLSDNLARIVKQNGQEHLLGGRF